MTIDRRGLREVKIKLSDRGPQPRATLRPGQPDIAPLRVSEFARLIGVAENTVYRWISAGLLPVITLPSGQFRIKKEEVDRILEQRA